jgi:DNA-binding Lrp family transcriptional regulator
VVHAALQISYSEKQQRAAEKRRILLDFLASGEVYTTLSIISTLLKTSEDTALRLVKKLTDEKILRADLKAVPFSNLKVYGITAHGLAITENAHAKCREFYPGSLNPSYLMHHIEGQKVRITLERAGWNNYIPGKLLYVENEKRMKSLPDALITRPDGKIVAIEIERTIKSHKRMMEVVGAHIQQIVAGHYTAVYYFTPHLSGLERLMNRVESVQCGSEKIKLNDSHRARFKLFCMDVDSDILLNIH